ncbi:YqhR family membrane protein [Gorillibacterium sp. sgz5001074]|uniref:YqhR family membrane protein n=1 Tax=Gorillibacterium sp. sgz5001074 TaxID=3446695 RepID=UPI003F674A70
MLRAKYKYRNRIDRSNKPKKETNPFTYALNIGLFAGLIWGGVKLIEFALSFTEIVPGFLIEPFFQHAYLVTYTGLALGYASFIALSMIAALIYVLLLRKLKGPLPGLVYGAAWWALIYLLVGPMTQMTPSIMQMDRNSFYSDLSLFLLWGLFIGYSIAYEFTDERSRTSLLPKLH